MTHTKTIELPDVIRVPLHELQADLSYLLGRIVVDGSCSSMIEASIRGKLDSIEVSIYQLLEDSL